MTRREYVKVEPESVDVGDTIEVVYPADKGIVKRLKGVVAFRENYVTGHRRLYTSEGGILLSWLPGTKVAVFRIARAAQEPTPLFEIDNTERIRA